MYNETMFKPDYLVHEHPRPGDKLRVADGVYWLHLPLPMALDHINVWLIDDGDGWVVVDTGLGTSALRQLWEAVIANTLDGKPIRRIVLTHFHPDHVGLAAWLEQRFDAEIVMTHGEWQRMCEVFERSDDDADSSFRELMMVHGLQTPDVDAVVGGGNMYRRVVPALPPTPHFVEAGDELTIDGRQWHVYIGRGHAPEHACLYRADDHVLLAGDQVLPRISSNISVAPDEPDADPVSDFVDSLQALKMALPADSLVLPGHGLPFRGLAERVDDLVQHHAEQLTAAETACRTQAQTAFGLLPVLFKRELKGAQILFAMGESIAHLNNLCLHGRAQREHRGNCWTFQSSKAG